MGARCARELARKMANSTGRAVDQHLLPEKHTALCESPDRAHPRHRQSRGLLNGHRGWYFRNRPSCDRNFLRPSTLFDKTDDARSGLRATTVGSLLLDNSGEVPAWPPTF